MHKYIKALFISLIFSLVYNLPIIILRNTVNHTVSFKIAAELILAAALTMVIFYPSILFFKKRLSNFFIITFFVIGGISNYYVINFGKFIDSGAIIDALTVEMSLVSEYVTFYLLLYIILSFCLGWFVTNKLETYYASVEYSKIKIIASILVFIISFGIFNFNFNSLRYMMKDFLPSSIIYNTDYFFTKYLPHFNKIKDKKDLTLSYPFKFNNKSNKPLIVVLIIGESMRGDILSINGYDKYNNTPLLSKTENVISFPNAISSATSTHISLPYMLTSATPPNFDQALSEKSIISIFKSLGFETTWIGNQGAFGFYETTFASNILESDYHVIQDDLRKSFKKNRLDIVDENILPFLDQRLESVKDNHFIVLHLLGSHWNFRNRYPASFGNKFTPLCDSFSKDECNELQLINSYHNTILYSDYVLHEILSRLNAYNVFAIYASDHGFSLGEANLFGNAYKGDNIPFEQITIGMFTWASPEFLLHNNLNYQKILDKKFSNVSHDFIFHSLLDCTGVESTYIVKDLSLCK